MSDDRIFVQIPSYRDPECQHTVADLFAQAAKPERVSVGICGQRVPEADARCFEVTTRPEQGGLRRADHRSAELSGLSATAMAHDTANAFTHAFEPFAGVAPAA